jgi:predicted ArsR family transcriptional regulator
MKGKEIGSTRRLLLHQLKSRGPQTAAELSEQLEITAVAVRQHLQGLGKQGMVSWTEERRPVGRPVRRWELSGEAEALFPDHHGDLAAGLLSELAESFGNQGLERLLEARTRRQIERYHHRMPGPQAPMEQRVASLAEIRSEEGYMAEWSTLGPDRWLLVENHCPICAAARACHGICSGEPELFRAALGDGVSVQRTEHQLAGARRCAYEIQRVDGSVSS